MNTPAEFEQWRDEYSADYARLEPLTAVDVLTPSRLRFDPSNVQFDIDRNHESIDSRPLLTHRRDKLFLPVTPIKRKGVRA